LPDAITVTTMPDPKYDKFKDLETIVIVESNTGIRLVELGRGKAEEGVNMVRSLCADGLKGRAIACVKIQELASLDYIASRSKKRGR